MLIKKIPKAGHFAWSNSKKNNYLFVRLNFFNEITKYLSIGNWYFEKPPGLFIKPRSGKFSADLLFGHWRQKRTSKFFKPFPLSYIFSLNRLHGSHQMRISLQLSGLGCF